MIEHASVVLAGLGTVFFIAGVTGLLRFPDVYSRLHALTKADNLGLGLVVLSLAIQTASAVVLLKLILIWFFVIMAGATSCYLVARTALGTGIRPAATDSKDGKGGGS